MKRKHTLYHGLKFYISPNMPGAPNPINIPTREVSFQALKDQFNGMGLTSASAPESPIAPLLGQRLPDELLTKRRRVPEQKPVVATTPDSDTYAKPTTPIDALTNGLKENLPVDRLKPLFIGAVMHLERLAVKHNHTGDVFDSAQKTFFALWDSFPKTFEGLLKLNPLKDGEIKFLQSLLPVHNEPVYDYGDGGLGNSQTGHGDLEKQETKASPYEQPNFQAYAHLKPDNPPPPMSTTYARLERKKPEPSSVFQTVWEGFRGIAKAAQRFWGMFSSSNNTQSSPRRSLPLKPADRKQLIKSDTDQYSLNAEYQEIEG